MSSDRAGATSPVAGSVRLSRLVASAGVGALVLAAQLLSGHTQLAVTYAIAAAALALGGVVVVRRRAGWRTGWPGALLGSSVTIFGSLLWALSLVRPAVAIAVIALGVPMAFDGYVRLVGAQVSPHHASLIQIDAGVLTVAVAYLAWMHVGEPMSRREGAALVALLVYGAFLGAALVAFLVGIRLALDRPESPVALCLAVIPLPPTAGGIMAITSGAVDGGPLAGWTAAANFATCVLLAAAAVHPSGAVPADRRVGSQRAGPRRQGAVALAAAVPAVSMALQAEPVSAGDEVLLVAATTAMALLIGLRVDVVVRQRDLSLRALDSLAHHDALTGLSNRRAAVEALERAVAEPGTRRCLAYLDLASFKQVNDTYGHEAGDRLLVAVAEALSGQAQLGDIVARMGGDEFLVLTDRATTDEEAAALCDRLTAAVSAVEVPIRGHVLQPSAYIGAALVRPGLTVQTLLEESDRAMYVDRAGRHSSGLPGRGR